MYRIINPWLGESRYNCFGCAPGNPIGLHMEFFEDGEYIISKWHPNQNHQSWINTMHGGVLSAMIDEICGWVVTRKLQTTGYTTSLNVKYRKQVMTTDPELTLTAHVTRQIRNIAIIHAQILNSAGELCVEGDSTYFLMPADKAREMGFSHCDVEQKQE